MPATLQLALRQPPFGCCQLFNIGAIKRNEEFFARGEVTIQGSRTDTRFLGKVFQAGVRADSRELPLRHFEDALAIAPRVRAQLSVFNVRRFPDHSENPCNRRRPPLIQELYGGCLRL